jgi:hypothetical protein
MAAVQAALLKVVFLNVYLNIRVGSIVTARNLEGLYHLAVAADGTILCLYTNGSVRDSEKISVARFDRAWLGL